MERHSLHGVSPSPLLELLSCHVIDCLHSVARVYLGPGTASCITYVSRIAHLTIMLVVRTKFTSISCESLRLRRCLRAHRSHPPTSTHTKPRVASSMFKKEATVSQLAHRTGVLRADGRAFRCRSSPCPHASLIDTAGTRRRHRRIMKMPFDAAAVLFALSLPI